MQPNAPFTQDLVLVGGGHAHALVLRSWGMNPLPGARLTVINPGPTAPYTGMLPGYVAGHYGREDLEIDLFKLCRHAGARLILDHATGIDQTARQITLENGASVGYDVASIDVGITAQMDLPGFAEHGVGAKPLDRYAVAWRAFLDDVKRGNRSPDVAVIGGGVAGCELAMTMAFALRAQGTPGTVTIIEREHDISGVGSRARAHLLKALQGLGVVLRLGTEIREIQAHQVLVSAGGPIASAFCVGAAGAFPHPWIAQTDLPLQGGFIEIGKDLGIKGDQRLFAVGDCAVMPSDPRPKAGVFAVRAAPVLKDNLVAALTGGKRRVFRPQKNYLKLISLGGKSALAEKFGFAFSGPILWRLKDRIDRKFMDRLSQLPTMIVPNETKPTALGVAEMQSGAPLCGGCGAKVANGVLAPSIPKGTPKGDLLKGAGDDAAVLRYPGGGFQVITTDHLRAFIDDPGVMTRIAMVHAFGDVWAMGATPQVVLSTLILPQMSEPLQRRSLREINQIVSQLAAQFGAQVAGGHTTLGAELTIGFTVTGTSKVDPIEQSGARAGDKLLLTKPIGSGVVMAAAMAGQAQGRDVAAALELMQQDQSRQAAILSAAHAMTDVTGFGLAGHLKIMCAASGVNATLWRDQIPYMAGARTLSKAGVASSLMPGNRAYAQLQGADELLLYDPQTAGGLLAALPAAKADQALDALASAGLEGWIIGELVPGDGAIHLQ